MTRTDIEEQIYQVFRDTKYPGDSNIVSNPDDWESGTIFYYLQGKTWQEVDRFAILEYCGDNLPLLAVEGYRYYLPTFMLSTLEAISSGVPGYILPENLVFEMTFSDDEIGRESWFLNVFMPLSLEQKCCVRNFLQYIASVYDEFDRGSSEEALSSFWENLPVEKIRGRWEYCLNLEKHFKQYYENIYKDRESCFQELEKSIFENASDEEIGKMMVYIVTDSSVLGGSAARGKRDQEEPRLREEVLFLYCLRRLEHLPDQKARTILRSVRSGLWCFADSEYGKMVKSALLKIEQKYTLT